MRTHIDRKLFLKRRKAAGEQEAHFHLRPDRRAAVVREPPAFVQTDRVGHSIIAVTDFD